MKVVINRRYGGFGLSEKAVRWLAEQGHELAKKDVAEHEEKMRQFNHYKEHGALPGGDDSRGARFTMSIFDISIKYGKTPDFYGSHEYERHDPLVVRVVEEMGDEVNGDCAGLKVVEIPDGVDYEIQEYDGNEWIAEKHRTWS
jgi:hypothetical protein